MISNNRLSLEVRCVILGYLKEGLDAAAMSTASASRAVRRQLPACILKDQELTSLIAEIAIDAGFGVSFEKPDHPGEE